MRDSGTTDSAPVLDLFGKPAARVVVETLVEASVRLVYEEVLYGFLDP